MLGDTPHPRAAAIDLEALDALCRAATPGPWHAPTIASVFRLARKTDNCCFDDLPEDQCVPGEDDAEWIAASRDALPALVALVRELAEALDEAADHAGDCGWCWRSELRWRALVARAGRTK